MLVRGGLLPCASRGLQPGDLNGGDHKQSQRYGAPCCRKFQHIPEFFRWKNVTRRPQQIWRWRDKEYGGALSSSQDFVEVRRSDVEHAMSRTGVEVPDWLHPWDGLLSVPKFGRPGPQ